MRTSNWNSLSNHKGSITEQSRRESNGVKQREWVAINSEIAGDNPQPRIKHGKSVDTKRINAAVLRTRINQAMDAARIAFGPRLVRKDGTALYLIQCK